MEQGEFAGFQVCALHEPAHPNKKAEWIINGLFCHGVLF
jgi:hypothetical protein